jgi:hypothetical protein
MMARDTEVERYRKAAHTTLDQLDWCIEYLRSLGKKRISRQLAKNRAAIVSRLSPREEDPSSRISREGSRTSPRRPRAD